MDKETPDEEELDLARFTIDLADEDVEDQIYALVAEEWDAGRIRKGLFTKAEIESAGDEAKARALYMGWRADQVRQQVIGTRMARLSRTPGFAKIKTKVVRFQKVLGAATLLFVAVAFVLTAWPSWFGEAQEEQVILMGQAGREQYRDLQKDATALIGRWVDEYWVDGPLNPPSDSTLYFRATERYNRALTHPQHRMDLLVLREYLREREPQVLALGMEPGLSISERSVDYMRGDGLRQYPQQMALTLSGLVDLYGADYQRQALGCALYEARRGALWISIRRCPTHVGLNVLPSGKAIQECLDDFQKCGALEDPLQGIEHWAE